MNKHWPTAPRCGHQPSSASLLLAAWADEQAAPAAAQGNLDAKQKSPQLGLHMQPGSSCLQRRWWHHAKYPRPLHRGVMIITIPPVPSGECLSPQNMWHFTDTITGIVATRLWGEKAPARLLHARWAHRRRAGSEEGWGGGGDAHPHSTGGKTAEAGFRGSLTVSGASGMTQGLLLATLAGTHAYICSPKV